MVIALLWSLGGCVSVSSGDDPQRVANDLLRAIASGDDDAACRLALSDTGRPIEKESIDWYVCKGTVNNMFSQISAAPGGLERYDGAKVGSVDLQGDQATIPRESIIGVLEPEFGYHLRRVDERWYLDLQGT